MIHQNQRWRRGVNRGKVLGRLLHSWVCLLTTESAANFDHSSGCSHRTHIRGGNSRGSHWYSAVTLHATWTYSWGALYSGQLIHGPSLKYLRRNQSQSLLSPAFPHDHNPAMPGPIPLPADTSLLRVPPKSCLMGLCPQVWHTLRITQYLSPQLLSEFQFSLSPLSFFVSSNPWSALLWAQGQSQSLKLMTPLCSVLIKWPPFSTVSFLSSTF